MSADAQQLIERATRGDASAIDALLERHLPQLHAYIRLRAGRALLLRESSADIAQSVCREVLDHLSQYQHKGEEEFRRWLYSTAVRKILNRYQYYTAEKRDFRRETPIRGAASGSQSMEILPSYRAVSTPSRRVAAAEEIERLERIFDRLSDDHREVILLSRVLGLPGRDVAEQMGRTETATRSLLLRALAALADEIETEERAPRGPHG